MPSAVVDEEVDTDWLNLLNDDKTHYCCLICYPEGSIKPLSTYIAMCGEEVLAREGRHIEYGEEVNVCEPCSETMNCPQCGTYRWAY